MLGTKLQRLLKHVINVKHNDCAKMLGLFEHNCEILLSVSNKQIPSIIIIYLFILYLSFQLSGCDIVLL